MTLAEIITALQDRNLVRVSEATGIHHNTLVGIRSGKIANPQRRTLDLLTAYLRASQ